MSILRRIFPSRKPDFSAPHPRRWARCLSANHPPSSISRLLDWKPDRRVDNVVVTGYVRSVRSMKANRFVSVGDGSTVTPLQALVPAEHADGLTIGTAVRLKGSWVSSPAAGQSHELHADTVDVRGPSDALTFPIQKKYQSAEYLRTIPHLRPRTPFNSALLRLRSEAIASMTHFFAGRDFTQTHPPIITSSDCEGAGEVFTLSPAKKSSTQEARPGHPFFRSPKYLTVSTQLHLEALAQAVGDVWTLSPTFRAEKSDTPRHLSEFYMLEAEMSFIDDLEGVMTVAEDILRHLASNLYDTKPIQELFWRPKTTGDDTPNLCSADQVRQRWKSLMEPAWPRLTYTDAVGILKANEHLFEHKPVWGVGLQTEHEKFIADHVGGGARPVFVTNYPRDIKPFYMLPTTSESPTGYSAGSTNPVGRMKWPGATVDCFDLLVPEFCEIAGGSLREHRLAPLLDSMRLHGLVTPALKNVAEQEVPLRDNDPGTKPMQAGDTESATTRRDPLDWYVDLRRWGCPPHGGFGLGFDRLLCYLSGVQSIRDIVAFPRWYGRCDC